MDQQQQPQPTPNAPSTTTPTATTDPPQQPQPQPTQTQTQTLPQPPSQTPQIQQQTTPVPPTTTPSTSTANPNPNPIPKPLPSPTPLPQPKPTLPTPQPRPTPTFSRPWQQHSAQFTHFSSSSPSVSSSPSPTLSSHPRGSIALGVPSSHSSPSPSPSPSQSTPFSGPLGHSFGGTSSSNVSQARPLMRGVGMGSAIGSSSQMRPGGISAQHQQRPVQSSLRPSSSPTSQPPSTQNFQGHGLVRVSAVGSSGSSTPSITPQTPQSPNQPWLSSGAQGKPPLRPPWQRPQINSPSLQPRSHIPQQHNSLPTVSQQQHVSSPQVPQTISSHQQQEHFEQHSSQSRAPQPLPHQQQDSRAQVSANQKPSSLAMVQPSTVQLVNQNKAAIKEGEESGGRILSKRSIQDLVSQIDPSEKLDPEVEDILVDIAEDFVDSITTFGCSLAKHRKSDTLEAKDILLHLERNWNMTLPGFSGDEIKTFKKPLTNEVHKERLAVIKKSMLVNEAANAKHVSGQATVNAKGNLGKAAANV